MVSSQLRLVYVKYEATVIFVYERLLLGEYNIVIWMLVIIINVLEKIKKKERRLLIGICFYFYGVVY